MSGLGCGTGDLCGTWDLLLWRVGFSLVVVCGFSLSSCDTWVPGHVGSVVVAHRLQGVWALEFACSGSLVEACELSSCGVRP